MKFFAAASSILSYRQTLLNIFLIFNIMFYCSVVATLLLLMANAEGISTEDYLVSRCESRCVALVCIY